MKFFNEIIESKKERKMQEVVKIRTPLAKKSPKRIPIKKLNKGKKIIVINILYYFISNFLGLSEPLKILRSLNQAYSLLNRP